MRSGSNVEKVEMFSALYFLSSLNVSLHHPRNSHRDGIRSTSDLLGAVLMRESKEESRENQRKEDPLGCSMHLRKLGKSA